MHGTAQQHILQVGCDDVAMKKARTAGLFHAESGDLGGIVQPGGPVSLPGILFSYIQTRCSGMCSCSCEFKGVRIGAL